MKNIVDVDLSRILRSNSTGKSVYIKAVMIITTCIIITSDVVPRLFLAGDIGDIQRL